MAPPIAKPHQPCAFHAGFKDRTNHGNVPSLERTMQFDMVGIRQSPLFSRGNPISTVFAFDRGLRGEALCFEPRRRHGSDGRASGLND